MATKQELPENHYPELYYTPEEVEVLKQKQLRSIEQILQAELQEVNKRLSGGELPGKKLL